MSAHSAVSEIIDPVFLKASPICSFSMTENECFGLVFTKTGSINSGTGVYTATLLVIVNVMRGSGRASPTLNSQG